MAAQFIQAGPGRSFSIPLGHGPPSPAAAASPTSASFVANDSPRPHPTPSYRRASRSAAARRNFSSNVAGDAGEDDRRSALVESLSRSATIVFWYEPGTPPLRICQEITTFPFFSFNLLVEVVEKLSLSRTTYLDAYDPRTRVWVQQQVSVVRRIESEQRLLFRVRRGLLDGLRDDECPGLEEELVLQEEAHRTTRKRAADQSLSPPVSQHHRSFSAQSYASTSYSAGNAPSEGSAGSPASARNGSPASATYTALPSAFELSERMYPLSNIPVQTFGSPRGSPDQPTTAIDPTPPEILYSPEVTEQAPLQDTPPTTDDVAHPTVPEQSILLERPPGPAPAPTFMSPAIVPPPPPAALTMGNGPAPRKWPNDFFVYEIAAGLREMTRLGKAEPALKQDAVFRRVFGAPYVKSTFCRHRALWRGAWPEVRAAFEERGRDQGAGWGEFARTVEGKGESVRVARGRARAARAGVEEAVMGMPLQMLRGAGQAVAVGMGAGAGAGVGVVSPSMAGVMQLPGPMSGEEPVMGSLRPPEEERQMRGECFHALVWCGLG
ncbi:hypothetical protein C8Q78DRAFT_1198541 [Trametes maxima]|nr:hypothetical protein C8Q78DRAFT_1198541 [Trametes maxima]